MKRLGKQCTIILFCTALLCVFLPNVRGAASAFWRKNGDFLQKRQSLEQFLLNDIAGKDVFTDICGLVRNSIGFDIIGNFEYVRDSDGMMQTTWNDSNAGVVYGTTFQDGVTQLKQQTEAAGGIPLVVVQYPDRGRHLAFSDALDYHGKACRGLTDKLRPLGIDVLALDDIGDIRSLTEEGGYFLWTDAHLSTEGEFLNAKGITNYLCENYAIEFPMTDAVYDPDSYTWTEETFRGNFSRSCGTSFVRPDIFSFFAPKWEPLICLTVADTGETREGDFQTVMVEREDRVHTAGRYYVTNFGQWPSPLYTYENLSLPQGPRLLVICDSMMLRTNTFLALNASRLTVADPRYFEGQDYLTDEVLNGQYDAVIISGASLEFYTTPFCPAA